MGKFSHSFGLPGYGTRGSDGSVGLGGLCSFFSAYDGISDSITIKSKITNNKTLFPGNEYISGYPSRTYQNGDIIIDKNGNVFEIDFTEANLYKTTGQQLNTSGFFEQGTSTIQTPVYTRYSNAYNTQKFLIDGVYASVAPGNYASNPNQANGIYGIAAVDFGEIRYVDNAINSYHPFAIYVNSNDITKPERAIAIVKEDGLDAWHFGNKVGSNPRDVSLFLDFKDVNFAGSVGDLNIKGNVTNGIYLYDSINADYSTNLITTRNYQTLFIKTLNRSAYNGTYNAGSININTGNGSDSSSSSVSSGLSGNLILLCGNGGNNTSIGTPSQASRGGFIKIVAGNGGFGGGPGQGGDVSIFAGNGGDSSTSILTGGRGGDFSVRAGNAGAIYIAKDSERGGDINLFSGNAARSGAVSQRAGNVTLRCGDGSFGTSSNGNGGSIYLLPGKNQAGTYITSESGKIYIGTNASGTMLGQSILPNGAVTYPSLAFSDLDTGIYSAAATKVSFASNGTHTFDMFYGSSLSTLHGNTDMLIAPVPLAGAGYDLTIHAGDSSQNGGHLIIRGSNGNGLTNSGDILIKGGDILGGGKGEITIEGGDINLDASLYNVFLFGDVVKIFSNTFGVSTLPVYSSGTVEYVYVNSVGNFYKGATVSDEKYKTITSTISNALDIIKLNGYKFKWNERSKELFDVVDLEETHMGLVAQEVEKLFPELVTEIIDEKKNITYKTVKYDKFVPYFVEALKEQQEQIEDLKDIISKQQEQIEDLKDIISKQQEQIENILKTKTQ